MRGRPVIVSEEKPTGDGGLPIAVETRTCYAGAAQERNADGAMSSRKDDQGIHASHVGVGLRRPCILSAREK